MPPLERTWSWWRVCETTQVPGVAVLAAGSDEGGATDARATEVSARVASVRRFNRFHTKQIGVLQEGHLRSRFGLAEVRVLYELAHRETPTAGEIAADLASMIVFENHPSAVSTATAAPAPFEGSCTMSSPD